MTNVIIYDTITIYLKKRVGFIVEIEYYEKENGDCPVLEFLESLPPKLQAKCLRDIDVLEQFGYDLREPYVKPIRGIYELRTSFSSNIVRIFYFTYVNNKFVLLHGIVKKSNTPPQREIDKALKRKEDYLRRYNV